MIVRESSGATQGTLPWASLPVRALTWIIHGRLIGRDDPAWRRPAGRRRRHPCRQGCRRSQERCPAVLV